MLIIRYLITRLITRAEEGFSKLRHGEIVSSLAMQHVQCAHYCCTAILVTSLPPSRCACCSSASEDADSRWETDNGDLRLDNKYEISP